MGCTFRISIYLKDSNRGESTTIHRLKKLPRNCFDPSLCLGAKRFMPLSFTKAIALKPESGTIYALFAAA